MKWMKRAILAGSLVFIFMLTGCYTVVSIPGRSVYRTETDEYIIEEEDYEDVIDEYDEDASVVVHEHYYYGDPWGMYVGFDPYWSSPYWWYYRSYGWATYYDPWYWWDPWPYGYGRYRAFPYYSGYYGGYYDPYWAYYSGYYSPEPAKRRPFERRVAYSEDGHAPPAVPLGEPRGAGVRKDTPATPATPTTTGAADTGSRPTTQRVKSSTSGSGGDRTTPQNPAVAGVPRRQDGVPDHRPVVALAVPGPAHGPAVAERAEAVAEEGDNRADQTAEWENTRIVLSRETRRMHEKYSGWLMLSRWRIT